MLLWSARLNPTHSSSLEGADMAHGPSANGNLHKGLKQRHLTMIAIGGAICAGLFVGPGASIG